MAVPHQEVRHWSQKPTFREVDQRVFKEDRPDQCVELQGNLLADCMVLLSDLDGSQRCQLKEVTHHEWFAKELLICSKFPLPEGGLAH